MPVNSILVKLIKKIHINPLRTPSDNTLILIVCINISSCVIDIDGVSVLAPPL